MLPAPDQQFVTLGLRTWPFGSHRGENPDKAQGGGTGRE